MAENCKIYTPDNWVGILLDEVGYKADLYGKRVLENSCGTGNILRRIVERYIVDALAHGYSVEQIRVGLENDIVGLEVDKKACTNCKRRLRRMARKYGISNIKWNVITCDALNYAVKDFSFVIGNPPYITYHDLDDSTRKLLRTEFETCKKGRFDYCYAFIEHSINSLQQGGKLAYIVPSSILKNVWAEDLRAFLLPHLRKILDLRNKNVFEDVTLSPVIIIAQKGDKNHANLIYQCDDDHIQISLNNNEISSDVWALGDYHATSAKHRFGDYFEVSNSVATLCNDAFLISEYADHDDDYLLADGILVERSVLRPAVSVKTLHKNPRPFIIFPYAYDDNGAIARYSEEDFVQRFPGAAAYIQRYQEKLNQRKADETAMWFEYGRSQAIKHLDCEKLVISVMVSGNVRVATADEKAIPFAGLYITSKGELPLQKAAEILQREDFKLYVKQYGVPTVKNSYRISKKILDAYSFDL